MTTRPAIAGGTPVREKRIPFHRPELGVDEEQAVLEVMRSGWLTRGARTRLFEERLCAYTGAEHALATNSCTAALELALNLAGVGPDDEVITTAMTFAATANTILHRGARLVLADVEPDTLNIDPGAVERALNERTRAVVAVDLAGHPADYSRLRPLTRNAGIALITDAAHALEARHEGHGVGQVADYAALSFYANKNITTGEGGALLLDNPDKADEAAVLSLHGMSKDAWKRYGEEGFRHYDVVSAGHKWNMFDLQAAIGLVQLERVDRWHERRRQIVARYDAGLQDQPGLELFRTRPSVRSAHHLYMVRLRTDRLSVTRDQVLDALQAEGIGVAVHYRALPQLSLYRQLGHREDAAPVAVDAGNRLLTLPLFPALTDAEVDDVVTALNRILDFYRG